MDLTSLYALLAIIGFKLFIGAIAYCVFYRKASKEAVFASVTYNVVKLGPLQAGKPKVVVTGACGHLGREVTAQLQEHVGDRVQVVALDAVARGPHVAGVTYIQADICNRAHLTKAFKGATCVLHLANIEPSAGTSASFVQRVNAEGTKCVMEACLETDIRSLVYASSGVVFLEEQDTSSTLILDIAPYPDTTTSGYPSSKRTAETYVLAGSSAYLRTVVLRTGIVYSHEDNWLGSTCLSHRCAVVGNGRNKMSLVWAKDAARAFVMAAEALLFAKQTKGQELAGKAFNLAHDPVTDPITLADFVQECSYGQPAAKPGRRHPTAPHMSVSMALLRARINEWLAANFGLAVFDGHTSIENLRLLTASLTLDISGARDVLGWLPTPWRQAVKAVREEHESQGPAATAAKKAQ